MSAPAPARLSPIAAIALAIIALLTCAPATLRAQTYPTWWSTYGVISSGSASDFSLANQGQAKTLAVAAVTELDNNLPQFGGAGPALDSLANTLLTGTATATDFAVINLGQLKTLAQPFYDRLIALGYTGPPLATGTSGPLYPWLAPGHNPPSDFAAANIGQLKTLFSFDPA